MTAVMVCCYTRGSLFYWSNWTTTISTSYKPKTSIQPPLCSGVFR